MKLDYIWQRGLGLKETDAVLGKRTKWSELYSLYSEQHFVKFDNEMRRFYKSNKTTPV